MAKKSGLIYIICGIIIVSAACFLGAKYLLPDAVSESVTNKQSSSLTQKITEIITETVASSTTVTTKKETTTEFQTTAISAMSSAKTTEKENVHVTHVNERFTLEIKLPTFPKPTEPSTAPVDYSCFDNCAFIGNSRVIALKNYGLVKNVYAVVGLNVDTVFTKSVSGSNIPVIDELNGKHFDKIYLMFGDNECGWPNSDVFIEHYAKVIVAVKERVPKAEIYIQSILPVSNEASESNGFGCNNPNINKLNEKLKQLAKDQNVHYIEPSRALKGTDGTLPPEAASDGIHLNKSYCKIWLNYLAANS